MSDVQSYYYLKDQSFTEPQQTAINLILRRIEDLLYQLQAGPGNLPGIAVLEKLTTNLTLTGTFTNVVGMRVELKRTGLWLLAATLCFSADKVDTFPQAQLVCAGKAQTDKVAVATSNGTNDQFYGVGQWLFNSVTGADVCTIQGKKAAGAGTSAIVGYSALSAVWIHP